MDPAQERLHLVPTAAAGTQRGPAAAVGAAEALLLRVARGDARAFEELYELLAPPVFGLALRVVRARDLAQDVSQEVLVDVWRLAPRFDLARGSALSWVLTMTHRRAVDRVRREEAQAGRTARAVALNEPAGDVVLAELEHGWDAAVVRRALDDLTPVQREAIELAYFDGRTHQQVAASLGIPLGTAKTRIRDGLIRLRDALGVNGW